VLYSVELALQAMNKGYLQDTLRSWNLAINCTIWTVGLPSVWPVTCHHHW